MLPYIYIIVKRYAYAAKSFLLLRLNINYSNLYSYNVYLTYIPLTKLRIMHIIRTSMSVEW